MFSFKSKTPVMLVMLAVGVGVLTLMAQGKAESAITWRHDAASALASAREERKPALLRFTASWCPPCRVMDARVWPDEDLGELVNQSFMPIEIDIDAPGAAEFARDYRVRGVPALVILDSEGKELSRAGFMSVGQARAFLEDALK